MHKSADFGLIRATMTIAATGRPMISSRRGSTTPSIGSDGRSKSAACSTAPSTRRFATGRSPRSTMLLPLPRPVLILIHRRYDFTCTARRGSLMAMKSLLEAVRDTLDAEMERDERVIILGEDVGTKGGVFKATEGLLDKFGSDRVLDAPLGEDSIVGVAIGAALNGMRPIAEIQFADFIFPAMDQIVSEAARMRYRTNGAFACPIVIRAPYGGGVHGALYHSQSLEAFFFHVPGLKICAPATPADAKGLLTAAIRDEDPVLFFEHKRLYRSVKAEVADGDFVLPIGRAEVKRDGKDLSVITYGAMLHLALEAAERMAVEDGTSVEVLDLRSLLPLDREAIAATVH